MFRMYSVSAVVATKCGSSVLWMQQYAMVRVSLLEVWTAGFAAGTATPVAAGRAAVGTAAAGFGASVGLAASAGFDSAGLAAAGALVGWAAGAAGWQASAARQSTIRTPYRRRVGRIVIVESLPCQTAPPRSAIPGGRPRARPRGRTRTPRSPGDR